MKFPIDWHENCLKNAEATYRKEMNHLCEEAERLEKTRVELDFYREQIQAANGFQHKKVAGFDSDKFLVKRKKDA